LRPVLQTRETTDRDTQNWEMTVVGELPTWLVQADYVKLTHSASSINLSSKRHKLGVVKGGGSSSSRNLAITTQSNYNLMAVVGTGSLLHSQAYDRSGDGSSGGYRG
jgi:hypothetical protein